MSTCLLEMLKLALSLWKHVARRSRARLFLFSPAVSLSLPLPLSPSLPLSLSLSLSLCVYEPGHACHLSKRFLNQRLGLTGLTSTFNANLDQLVDWSDRLKDGNDENIVYDKLLEVEQLKNHD